MLSRTTISRIPYFALHAALALTLLTAPAAAQDDAPESANVGHTRHHHPRNPKHPRIEADATRFTTDRQAAALELPAEEGAFSFVVFGDRTGGPSVGVSVLADAVRDVNLLEPDFVITVGDLIEGYNQTAGWMKQMREYRAVMDNLLCPWFPVAGNHDIYWRGSEPKPPGEHEGRYETHFGPLWYAFEHKNCWFIVLYTDEGNPETGEKTFGKPECQRMSPEQLAWLEATLERTKDADHVFAFMHHPRWLGGQYGEDWDKVHTLLESAGNVTAAFAGHIHRMNYVKRDSIEYVTLATTGGHQSGYVPDAGWLHHYHVVTVREKQVAMAALPVGEVLDVREITGDVVDETRQLTGLAPEFNETVVITETGTGGGNITATITNPTSRAIDVIWAPESEDSHWVFWPDHMHDTIAPGASQRFAVQVRRRGTTQFGPAFRLPYVTIGIDYLAPSARYAIPERRVELPLEVRLPRPEPGTPDGALLLTRETDAAGRPGHLRVPSSAFELPDGPFTLECIVAARAQPARAGVVAKTEDSEYGLFLMDGFPEFYVHLDGSYVTARAPERLSDDPLGTHIACVFDGSEMRLYVGSERVAAIPATGTRTRNALPLLIGADVNGRGDAVSPFDGVIDDVRLSSIARYEGDRIEGSGSARLGKNHTPDDATVLSFAMDPLVGPLTRDASAARAHARAVGPVDITVPHPK